MQKSAIQKKSVCKLLMLDTRNFDIQLKDSELEIGLPGKQALRDVKHGGKQKQCYMDIRFFFRQTMGYLQKSLELNSPPLEALTCLIPDEKTGPHQFRNSGQQGTVCTA